MILAIQRAEFQGFDDAYFGNPKKVPRAQPQAVAYETGFRNGEAARQSDDRRVAKKTRAK